MLHQIEKFEKRNFKRRCLQVKFYHLLADPFRYQIFHAYGQPCEPNLFAYLFSGAMKLARVGEIFVWRFFFGKKKYIGFISVRS